MKKASTGAWGSILLAVILAGCSPSPERRGADSITAEELKIHLDILAADEFRGRNTPSPELKITSRYLAVLAASYGFMPLLPDGEYLQPIPLVTIGADAERTRMTWTSSRGRQEFDLAQDFGFSGRISKPMRVSGPVLFVGLGLSAPDQNWDDMAALDLTGHLVVMLDPDLPEGHLLMADASRRLFRRRSWAALQKGATAVLTVISEAREREFQERGMDFSPVTNVRLDTEIKSLASASPRASLLRAEIRHGMAAALLGVSLEELSDMFSTLRKGEPVPARTLPEGHLDIRIETNENRETTYNVVAWLEGTDDELKQEYVLIGSHHDHVGARDGRIFNGADDNGSGTVAMLEIAQALALARPKRSVILVWHTAEEKGLWGARYFVENSPVPVEKMSAQINLDMISRNDPDHLYLIGSRILSTSLDEALHTVNEADGRMTFDYAYEDPKHADRFFFRSDHYPYIQYGIPAVWLFCGTTEDYHQETDTVERVDFQKMAKVTRLAYLTTLYVGNLPRMLSLDAHSEISRRGAHNLSVAWR
jgi:hypothetical protein